MDSSVLSFVVQPTWQSYISSYCFGINLSSIFCRIYIDKRNNRLPVTCKSALICESKSQTFRSDRYQFTVVMPNMNYDVSQDVPQDKLNCQIMDLIRKDSKVSTEKMAIAIGVSSKTIKRHIKEMDNVSYIGRGFSGHWEIADDKKL